MRYLIYALMFATGICMIPLFVKDTAVEIDADYYIECYGDSIKVYSPDGKFVDKGTVQDLNEIMIKDNL